MRSSNESIEIHAKMLRFLPVTKCSFAERFPDESLGPIQKCRSPLLIHSRFQSGSKVPKDGPRTGAGKLKPPPKTNRTKCNLSGGQTFADVVPGERWKNRRKMRVKSCPLKMVQWKEELGEKMENFFQLPPEIIDFLHLAVCHF